MSTMKNGLITYSDTTDLWVLMYLKDGRYDDWDDDDFEWQNWQGIYLPYLST